MGDQQASGTSEISWTSSRRFSHLLLGFLLMPVVPVPASLALRVEVFTTEDRAVPESLPATDDVQLPSVALDVYEIDGIQQFETGLSRGLPHNIDAAKEIALERITGLSEAQLQRARRAATGLARAMQYGIDRYPAIVFDGQAVVYGVTDLDEALHRYRQWREAPTQ